MIAHVEKSVVAVFAPRGVHRRVAMHSFAMTIGAVAAARMGPGGPWWSFAAWYVGFFVAAHVAIVPFFTFWYAARDRVERWIRSIIEEELIAFDLRTYQNQLHRVFPRLFHPPGDDEGR